MDFDRDKDYGQSVPDASAEAWDAADIDEPAITAPTDEVLEAAQALVETEEADDVPPGSPGPYKATRLHRSPSNRSSICSRVTSAPSATRKSHHNH